MRKNTSNAKTTLNYRDNKALQVLAELRAARLDDLAKLLAFLGEDQEKQRLGERTTRGIVARWQALGLVSTHTNPRGGLAIVAVEKGGCRYAEAQLRASRETFCCDAMALPTGLPPWRDLPHDLTVGAVAVELVARRDCTWLGETTTRANLPPGTHRPDGVAITASGATVAVEIERHTKSRKRWRENVGQLLAHCDRAVYFCPENVAHSLGSWLSDNLVAGDLRRVVVTGLEGLHR